MAGDKDQDRDREVAEATLGDTIKLLGGLPKDDRDRVIRTLVMFFEVDMMGKFR